MTFRQLQQETAERLQRLRKEKAHGIAPEAVSLRAKERGLHVSARTIREWEAGRAKPNLETLHTLLEVCMANY
jgi:DNA-binding transcriptional regulator YiaG